MVMSTNTGGNGAGEGTSQDYLLSRETKMETNFSDICDKTFGRLKFFVYADVGSKTAQNENHLKRLQNLRKELNFIKETEWLYDPVEKRIGHL